MARATRWRWVFCAALASAAACAPLLGETDASGPFTSLPAGGAASPGTGGSVGDGNGAGSPNAVGGGNDQADPNAGASPSGNANSPNTSTSPNAVVTPSVDPCVVAILAHKTNTAVYGIGFALEAVDYPTYCLAASNSALSAGTTLRLVACANVLEQQWGWSRGQLALNKRMCVLGGTGNASALTLQSCALGSTSAVPNEQNWSLPIGTSVLQRTLAGGQVVQAWSVDPANPTGTDLLGQAPTTVAGLRLRVGALPQTDGVRLHAKVNGTDLCLADAGAAPKFVGCGNDATQVWRMVADQWRSAPGNCLFGDASSGAVTMGICSVQPPANARWGLLGGFITFGGAPTAGSLVLGVDGSTSAPKLSAPGGLSPAYAFGAPTGYF